MAALKIIYKAKLTLAAQKIPFSLRPKPACTWGRDCFFYRLLLSWAGNWIKIRPPKKSQGAIGNSTDPVSRGSLKWPNERGLLKRYYYIGSNGLKWCRFVSLVKFMEKKYATYYWWWNLLGVFVVQYKPSWEWSNRACQALIPCDEKQTLLHESGRNWTVLSKTQNLLLDITVFVQWVWIMTTIKKLSKQKHQEKKTPPLLI